MTGEDILIKPVISEKAVELRDQNKYVFIVDPKATKAQIKDAVSKKFGVKVVSCTTCNVKGKPKRLRGRPGKTSARRKAVVRLEAGQKIQIFEGA